MVTCRQLERQCQCSNLVEGSLSHSKIRTTYTFTTLEISREAYDEIRAKLVEAGYQHTLREEDSDGAELIDMHGIALKRST